MTALSIDLNTQQPDRNFVEVNCPFDVAIERTETGISLREYAPTDGEWIEHFTTKLPNARRRLALPAGPIPPPAPSHRDRRPRGQQSELSEW